MPDVNTSPDDLIQPFYRSERIAGPPDPDGPTLSDIRRHDLPPAVQSLMAEFAVLAATLSAALKLMVYFPQAKGNGPVTLWLLTSQATAASGSCSVSATPGPAEIEGSSIPRLLSAGS